MLYTLYILTVHTYTHTYSDNTSKDIQNEIKNTINNITNKLIYINETINRLSKLQIPERIEPFRITLYNIEHSLAKEVDIHNNIKHTTNNNTYYTTTNNNSSSRSSSCIQQHTSPAAVAVSSSSQLSPLSTLATYLHNE